MTKIRFEVPITAQHHEALGHAAEEIGVSPRDLARIAIHKFLKEPPKPRRQTYDEPPGPAAQR